jgi:ankyrin repeat protein
MTKLSKMHMEHQLIDFAKRGDIVNIQRLIEEEQINPAAHNNQAFWWACNKGHLNVVKLLLRDLRVSPSARMNAAIVVAAEMGRAEVVEFLLADARVNPAESGNVAVHSAARNGHYDVVELLVSDERVDATDANNTAIRRASANGHMDIVQMLLAYAANLGVKKFDEVYQAAFSGFIGEVSKKAAEYLVNKEEVRVIALNHAEIIKQEGFSVCSAVIRNAHSRKRNYNNVSKISNAIEAKKAKDSVKKNADSESIGWEILDSVLGKKAPKANLTVVQQFA